jgi:hypothetical protein
MGSSAFTPLHVVDIEMDARALRRKKRRPVRARALPEAAGAKPGGADTTTEKATQNFTEREYISFLRQNLFLIRPLIKMTPLMSQASSSQKLPSQDSAEWYLANE